jgi:hypothetical protein
VQTSLPSRPTASDIVGLARLLVAELRDSGHISAGTYSRLEVWRASLSMRDISWLDPAEPCPFVTNHA